MAERGEYQLLVSQATDQALAQPFYREGRPILHDPIPDPEPVLDLLIERRLLATHLKNLNSVPTAKDFEKAATNSHIDARVRSLQSRVHEAIALRTYANFLAHATDGQFIVIPGEITDWLTRGFDFLNFERDPIPENARKYRQPKRPWTPDATIADRSKELLIGAVEITRMGTQDYCDGKDGKLAANAALYHSGFTEDPYCQFVVPIDSCLPVSEDRLFRTPYEDDSIRGFALRTARAQSVLGLPARGKVKQSGARKLRPSYSH